MKTSIFLIAGAVVILCGCSSSAPVAKSADADRKSVAAPVQAAPKHNIVERDGKPYILMDQSDRLCSDCDR